VEAPKIEPASFTIDEFCSRHGICRATYYNLKKVGKAPREMELNRARRISGDSEKDRVKDRERAAVVLRETFSGDGDAA
jgi:hypothetical protein